METMPLCLSSSVVLAFCPSAQAQLGGVAPIAFSGSVKVRQSLAFAITRVWSEPHNGSCIGCQESSLRRLLEAGKMVQEESAADTLFRGVPMTPSTGHCWPPEQATMKPRRHTTHGEPPKMHCLALRGNTAGDGRLRSANNRTLIFKFYYI